MQKTAAVPSGDRGSESGGRPQSAGTPDLQERPPGFDLKVERKDSLTYIELLGELDLSCEARFAKAVDTVRSDRLVLDLRGLTFIDSSGLRLIIRTWERSLADGFDLRIVGARDQVAKVFRVTGIEGALPLVDPSMNGHVPAVQ